MKTCYITFSIFKWMRTSNFTIYVWIDQDHNLEEFIKENLRDLPLNRDSLISYLKLYE